MSFDHAGLMTYLELQLDRRFFSVRLNHGRLRQGDRTYDIPGVIVIPAELAEPLRGKPAALEIDDALFPLGVEIWSSPMGDYDVDAKIPAYMARGDREIWRIHP